MKTTTIFAAMSIITLLLISCVVRHGNLALVGTEEIDLNMKEVEKVKDDVKGRSTSAVIIFVPTGRPSIGEAVTEALEKADGDIMTDVEIYFKWWMIPLIYYRYIIEIEGDVWKVKEKSSGLLDKESFNKTDVIYKLVHGKGRSELIKLDNLDHL